MAVPTGSEGDVQPSVAVLPPVPEQCAAWPMNTSVPLVKTKLAVHCAPSVVVWTPGWIAADAAGAHVGAAPTGCTDVLRPSTARVATANAPSLRDKDNGTSPDRMLLTRKRPSVAFLS